MKTSIKSLLLLVAMSLVVACSSQVDKGEKDSTKPEQPTVIKGMVQSIESGKDGYTADVQTQEEGVYVALVSIVNLGGPDNYQRFNIGDRVTLEGESYLLGDKPQLKVERIINVAPSRTQLTISPISFRGIKVGDAIDDHSEYIQKEQLRTGEGNFLVYRIKDFNNNPAGYLMPDPNNEELVGDITIETQMAKTAKGIKVGSTFGDLKAAFPNINAHGSEIEGRTYAKANNISYRLDVANFSYEMDNSKIPTDTKIIQIIINRDPSGVYANYAKLSSIAKEEYCWQVNKVLELYTKPTTNSLIQGKHFQGEVLSVLESRIIENQLWVNVEYRLSIKAGYEDQFADGQVMSSGVPTGWIGGEILPSINCK